MTTMRDLMDEAKRLGVSVQLAHVESDTIQAHYDEDARLITLDLELTMCEVKDALAHELGHALYGHRCSTDPNERRADRRAASLLIDPISYRTAELIDADPQFIADELGVTRRIVRVWQKEWMPSVSLMKRYARV
ncbi:MAG: ImmA/IrrE family metallo-endopeptidase [Rhodoglobus sp.]|nr:ImmA/IrrE family metallo-endopeptidase [Rhodoglobus sp.]